MNLNCLPPNGLNYCTVKRWSRPKKEASKTFHATHTHTEQGKKQFLHEQRILSAHATKGASILNHGLCFCFLDQFLLLLEPHEIKQMKKLPKSKARTERKKSERASSLLLSSPELIIYHRNSLRKPELGTLAFL